MWISLFLTCGANNCSMVRNERVTFNCKVTFVQDLFHCHVLGGPAFKSSQVPNASLTFSPLLIFDDDLGFLYQYTANNGVNYFLS